MGRWAQRHRSGGGYSLNFIVVALIDGDDSIEVDYLKAVTAANFDPADFDYGESGSPVSVTQLDTLKLRLTFSENIDSAQTLTFTGVSPNILSPQTIAVA